MRDGTIHDLAVRLFPSGHRSDAAAQCKISSDDAGIAMETLNERERHTWMESSGGMQPGKTAEQLFARRDDDAIHHAGDARMRSYVDRDRA